MPVMLPNNDTSIITKTMWEKKLKLAVTTDYFNLGGNKQLESVSNLLNILWVLIDTFFSNFKTVSEMYDTDYAVYPIKCF